MTTHDRDIDLDKLQAIADRIAAGGMRMTGLELHEMIARARQVAPEVPQPSTRSVLRKLVAIGSERALTADEVEHYTKMIEGMEAARGLTVAPEAPFEEISPVYAWLTRSTRSGIIEVDHAARTMMAYYQGAEFSAPAAQQVGAVIGYMRESTIDHLGSVESTAMIWSKPHASDYVPVYRAIPAATAASASNEVGKLIISDNGDRAWFPNLPDGEYSLFPTGDVRAPSQEAQAAHAGADAGRLKALHAAVSALYFDDSSDFRPALGSVIRFLDPELAGDMLGTPKAAYDKVCAAIASNAADQGEKNV